MTTQNSFQHQKYSAELPQAPYEIIEAPFPPQPGTPAYEQLVSQSGKRIAKNVDAIYLIHGTFVGNDVLGWTEQLEKIWPQSVDPLRSLSKKLVDTWTGDQGNFTQSYADQLQDIVCAFEPEFPARLFHWSGENNHVARCVAAIELLDQLIQRLDGENRILLIGHSHAGNVLALVSNLMGANNEARDHFLKIIRPVFNDVDEASGLQRFAAGLSNNQPWDRLTLDVVTMGTPIRYDWNRAGYRKLLHFVNHAPRQDAPEYLSPLPKNAREILKLRGDFVQQFGIAGTNIWPYLFDLRRQLTEQKLNRLLQPFSWRQLWEHLKIGMRVAQQGTTLLVDYEDELGLARKLAGHGVYTETEWLPFHMDEITRRFYSES